METKLQTFISSPLATVVNDPNYKVIAQFSGLLPLCVSCLKALLLNYISVLAKNKTPFGENIDGM